MNESDFDPLNDPDTRRKALLDQMPDPNALAPTGAVVGGSSLPPATTGGAPAAAPAATPGPFDRTAFRDAWQGSSGTSDQFMAAHPEFGAVQWSGNNRDVATLPGGERLDLVTDSGPGGQNLHGWGGVGGEGGAGGGAFGSFGGASGAGNGASGSLGGPGGSLDDTFRQTLLSLMQGANSPISINDQYLQPQSSAYANARQRSAQQERGAMAERAAFTGLNSGGQGSGAFDTGLQGIQEHAGQDIASHDAGLVGQEVQAKRQQLQQALQLANAVGARTEAAALQKQLAEMESQYRYSALGQQQGQFEDTTANDWAKWQALMNRTNTLDAMHG